jgi:hypothetical protein
MTHELIARIETNATAFEFNPWLMYAAVCAVREAVPDATKIEVYRDGGLIAALDPQMVPEKTPDDTANDT